MPLGPNAPLTTDLTAMSRSDKVPAGFSTTELVERCRKLIAATASVSPIPPNIHTIGQVFSIASLVYKDILALSQKFECSTKTDVDLDPPPFDAYTIGILLQLERFLIDLVQAYTQEKFRGHLPPSNTTANGILYVRTWQEDRDFLAKSLEKLKHDDFKGLPSQLTNQLIASYSKERQEDDKALLTALLKFLQENKFGDEHIEQGTNVPLSIEVMKGELVNIAEKLLSSPYNEVATSVVIRTLMYFAIPCTLILFKDVDGLWKIYLRKAIIWEAFNLLIAQVKTYVNAPQSTNKIEKMFTEIEKLLSKLGDTDISTAAEMLSLFRLGTTTCRQYHGRSLALIKTLYYLDSHSRKPEQKAFAIYRYDLKQIMMQCAKSLPALSKTGLDLTTFSMKSTKYKTGSKEIEGLFDKTKSLFQYFEADAQLSRYESMFDNAVSNDENHVEEAKKAVQYTILRRCRSKIR